MIINKLISFMAAGMFMLVMGACSGAGSSSSPADGADTSATVALPTPEVAVADALNAMKNADIKALAASCCDLQGNPIDISELGEDEIKEAGNFMKLLSEMEYTIGAADINNNFAKVEVTVKFKGEEQTTTVVCIKCPDGKWLVYDSDLVR